MNCDNITVYEMSVGTCFFPALSLNLKYDS